MRLLAHRGSPGTDLVENTVPAVLAAFTAGADGVEVDLRLTADGVLAVCHDADLRRVAGRPAPVHETAWDVLRTVAGEVPLARLEWVLAAAAGRPVVLELKPGPTRAATVLADRLTDLAAAGLPLEVTVSSFDRRLISALRRAVPQELGVRSALLGAPGRAPLSLLRQSLRSGHDAIHPHVDDLLAGEEAVAAARGCGVDVVPWTVNDVLQLRRCADLSVPAVITDVPGAARRQVSARRQRAVVM